MFTADKPPPPFSFSSSHPLFIKVGPALHISAIQYIPGHMFHLRVCLLRAISIAVVTVEVVVM